MIGNQEGLGHGINEGGVDAPQKTIASNTACRNIQGLQYVSAYGVRKLPVWVVW
jgi:hypothetical protein